MVDVDVNHADVDRLSAELGRDNVLPIAADVVDRAKVEAVITTAAGHFGNLYGLVNSAGVRPRCG